MASPVNCILHILNKFLLNFLSLSVFPIAICCLNYCIVNLPKFHACTLMQPHFFSLEVTSVKDSLFPKIKFYHCSPQNMACIKELNSCPLRDVHWLFEVKGES